METLNVQTEQQFDLAAAQREAEAVIAGGNEDYMNMMTSSLLTESAGIELPEQESAEAGLRLALGVAAEAQAAGITPMTSDEEMKGLYMGLFADAEAYRQSENFDPAVAAAKDALAMGIWNKMNTPVAVREAR